MRPTRTAGSICHGSGIPAGPAQHAADLSRALNDRWAEVVAAHPDRFNALATLPTQDPDADVVASGLALARQIGAANASDAGRGNEIQLHLDMHDAGSPGDYLKRSRVIGFDLPVRGVEGLSLSDASITPSGVSAFRPGADRRQK